MLTHAGEAIILAGFFTVAGVGQTGLTVTIDVYRVQLSDLATTQVVTGGSATALGGGLYGYRHVTSAGAYYYYGILKTTDTSVDQQQIPAAQIAGIPLASRIDENVSAAKVLAAAGLDAVLIESGITAGAGLTNDTGTQLTSVNARQAVAAILSAVAAVLAGAATATVTTKPAAKPAGNNRLTVTADADGNRSAVSLKVPD